MSKYPGLERQKGSGIFHFRRGVPEKYRKAFGKREVKRSLKTRYLGEAIPNYLQQAAEFEQRLREAKAAAPDLQNGSTVSDRPDSAEPIPSPSDIRTQAFDQDARRRVDVNEKVRADEGAFWRGEIIAFPQTAYFDHLMQEPDPDAVLGYCLRYEVQEQLRLAKRDLQLGDWREYLDQIPAAQPKHVRLRLARTLMEAHVSALDAILKRSSIREWQKESSGAPQEPRDGQNAPGPGTGAQSKNANPMPILSVALTGWIDQKAREKKALAYQNDNRTSVNWFIEIAGDKPVTDYRKTDGRNFRAALMHLPANLHKKSAFKELSLKEAVAKAKADDMNPMTITTLNKRLGAVASCFRWIKLTHDGDITNPTEGFALKRTNSSRDDRDPFTPDEMEKIFTAPVYSGCKSVRQWYLPGDVIPRESAKFWVPLIGLTTGMREGEIIQLRVGDVKIQDGVHYFDIVVDDYDGNPERRKVKNRSSIRAVPLHQALLDIGFMDFVKIRQRDGSRRLFPDVEPTVTKTKHSWSDSYSKYFTRFLKKVDAKTCKNSFHSFRHNFKDFARNSGVAKDIRDAITGHAEYGVSGDYGDGFSVASKAAAMRKIEFVGVDLAHLRP